MRSKIDELNYPKISYEEYFSVLDIPTEDKEKRIELAEKIDDVFDWLFAVIALWLGTREIDTEYLIMSVEYRLRDVMDVKVRYVSEHIVRIANETVESTVKNADREYFLSPQRSSEIAADEAHTFFNYEEAQEAYENGKTKKTWKTRRDKKVRDTHAELEGKTIPIDKMFNVGGFDMFVPHDSENGADIRELAGCRCWCTYS